MARMFLLLSVCAVLCCLVRSTTLQAQVRADRARNPIIWADVPDPAVVRVDSVYYMTSTTMHMSPGVPIMKSLNLVDWEIIGYAYEIMANADALFMRHGQNAYGRGSWASCIRYHRDRFYIVTFSYTTGETYIFSTRDIENGPWQRVSLSMLFHDPSLLFDDDERVYLVYGVNDIRIVELTKDASAVLPGGIDRVLIPNAGNIAGTSFYVPGEGSHIVKVENRYYLFLIVWPRGGMRTELVYRADNLEGPWEGRIILEDEGIAQGGIVDTPEGDWYALLFGDRGAVGRIPYLVPVSWDDAWPVFGIEGNVPNTLDIPSNGTGVSGIVVSDEFNDDRLDPVWQWNHNPIDNSWSLTERPGFLRITNDRRDLRMAHTRNTLTQRTFGPYGEARVALHVNGMNNGDVAGLGLLLEDYAYVGIKKERGETVVIMAATRDGQEAERALVPYEPDVVYLKVATDFRDQTDKARFYYSRDGRDWKSIGGTFQMRYTLGHFMGARFALFNYATQVPGGWADFDYFHLRGEPAF